MKRLALPLLISYAATATVVAVWFGCRVHVVHRLLVRSQIVSSGSTLEEALVDTGMARTMTGPVEIVAISLAVVQPAQIVGVAGLTLLGCSLIASLRRKTPEPTAPTHPKD